MIKVLIIADDFTGALDTGVKFAQKGAKTKVMTKWDASFVDDPSEVLVLCVPTRHESPEDAYDMVKEVVEIADGKVGTIFKKTDSVLRGNVGAELTAVLEGSSADQLYFIPALPSMRRITLGGIHYVAGIAVKNSVFGRDPFDPVTESYVPDLLHKQSDAYIESVSVEDAISKVPAGEGKAIYVYDCESSDTLDAELKLLCKKGMPKLVAGCSGLAQALATRVGDETRTTPSMSDGRLTVVCGSVNPISIAQMNFAERYGFSRVHMVDPQFLEETDALAETAQGLVYVGKYGAGLIVDTLYAKDGVQRTQTEAELEKTRALISKRTGLLMKYMLESGYDGRLMIIGGDTLLEFANSIGCYELYPMCEIDPGTVVFKLEYQGKEHEIITKSGGFGSEELLVKIAGGIV